MTDLQKQTIELLNPWHKAKSIDLGIRRTKYLDQIKEIIEKRKQILFLLGSRRVGKTMIIFQYIYQLINEKVNPKEILFLSLDNTNLENLDLFTYLSKTNFKYIFLDEIHFFPNWAQVLKSLYDLPNFRTKIICSGSSSKLIEDNKAFLTGRSTSLIITPLSYIEFLEFNKSENQLKDYLYYGGYPEYVIEKQPNYLNEVARDLIEKDISKVYSIKNTKYLFDICNILAKQIGFRSSSNKISKVLNIDNKTVLNYIEYLKEVRLIETVYQNSNSLNEKLYAQKKYYFCDLGMRNSFAGFSDLGSLIENAVYIRLCELFGTENISYEINSKLNEIDFIIKIDNDKLILVESKYINLQESIINSLSKTFFDNINEKNILRRIVITNGVNNNIEIYKKKIEMISLENFLIKLHF